jgi:alkylation response protein AidB-like acyl-CoA dehydrogenase
MVVDLRAPRTPQGRTVLDLVRGHAARIRETAAENDRAGIFPVETFDAFAKDGLMGATVPAELGGLGLDQLYDVAVALSAVAEADASTALAWHVQLSRGLTLTWEWHNGEPRVRVLAERLLREMATGEAAVCGAVKDHHTAVTTATRESGGTWVVSGRKTLVSMAPIATHFVVHTQTVVDGEPPMLASVLLPRDAPGLSIDESWDGLGMRASGTADIVFDRCRVTEDAVLPRRPIGADNDAVLAGQTVSSITMLGIYAGAAQAARDLAVEALARRSRAPAGAARTLLTEVEAHLYALRVAAAAALVNADELSADLTMDRAERGRQMMTPFQCAKLTLNQLSETLVSHCLSVVGGAAYAASHPLARIYRDARAGWFMQPYTFVDVVDYLSARALNLRRDNDYVSVRATNARTPEGAPGRR